LKELTFLIKTGEVVGVVGPSGAGKSTLVQLLLGLREPTSGAIEIDGINLRDVDRASWNSRVAFVAQDATLFTGTVADNIRFFRSTVSDSDLRDAATQANLLNEIEHLPDGFDTFLGERGTRLSGGQRQRLSIARALAGRPEFLILDEPTSALDSHSEALIRDTIASLRSKVTVVIIAHRMSTIDMCDRIIVIEQGQMTAFETPEVLRSTSGFYRLALERSGMT
ncbi:MAG: ATP-binding cassette domain-containing protein, partial [Actinobacteria bacterium]|nr:ATP-binding cassette domain-containing protein [Actinomycetota bacterium]